MVIATAAATTSISGAARIISATAPIISRTLLTFRYNWRTYLSNLVTAATSGPERLLTRHLIYCVLQCSANVINLAFGEPVMERQCNRPLGDTLGNREVAFPESKGGP